MNSRHHRHCFNFMYYKNERGITMITYNKSTQATDKTVYVEGVCLSSDAKPTSGIANGSMLIEINTGKIFMFNEAGSAWVELS